MRQIVVWQKAVMLFITEGGMLFVVLRATRCGQGAALNLSMKLTSSELRKVRVAR